MASLTNRLIGGLAVPAAAAAAQFVRCKCRGLPLLPRSACIAAAFSYAAAAVLRCALLHCRCAAIALALYSAAPFRAAAVMQVRLAMGERPGEDGIPRPIYMLAMVTEVEERAPGVYK